MHISVFGTGYVGLVVGACLADMGHHVVCVDSDRAKIEALQEGRIPIYEPGLADVVARNVREGRLAFTLDGVQAIEAAEVVFIAVGTPSMPDGSADISGVLEVTRIVAGHARSPLTLVIKSTVPVGTSDRVLEVLAASCALPHEVVNNPEFLKEGAALEDFRNPDRIVVGCRSEGSRRLMERIYGPVVRTGHPILFMDNRSAEMTKYASNAFLATRISFINDLARLCERVGADIEMVRRGAGSDSRIGMRFFFPGAGYGGSCFPKDVRELQHLARRHGQQLRVVDAVEEVNEDQKHLLADKVMQRFGPDLAGRTFALWGLAFKPRTDDMREAPSLAVIHRLIEAGARLVAFDPEAMEEARRRIGDRIAYAPSPMEAADGADALLLVTEWNEFRSPDFVELARRLGHPVVFDGRNIWEPEEVAAAGLEYHGIGRPIRRGSSGRPGEDRG
ncbi:MAG: UDP-glucose/GDP-mannose dehydrogenase family protein [Deltaproteobacteria bacterium]|nr:UDP-glucose/GDP-mannose dehydrogenase family protein [Deltaproteobacteria bacterium]